MNIPDPIFGHCAQRPASFANFPQRLAVIRGWMLLIALLTGALTGTVRGQLLNVVEVGGTFRAGNLSPGGTAFASGGTGSLSPHLIKDLVYGETGWRSEDGAGVLGIRFAQSRPVNRVAFSWLIAQNYIWNVEYTTAANPDLRLHEATGWITIGTVNIESNLGLRQLFSFPTVNATAIRIIDPEYGYVWVDELEIYNEALSVAAPTDRLIAQGSSTGALPFGTSRDPDPTMTATSSDQSLVPNANIVLGGTAGNRTVTVTPNPTQSGKVTITLTGNVGTNSASDSFVIDVTTAPQEEGGTARAGNLAPGGVAFAKDLLPGFADHTIPHLNDGIYGNANSWIGNSGSSFAGISFGTRVAPINQLAFGRDNTGVHTTRANSIYYLQYTQVPNPDANTGNGSWINIRTLNSADFSQPALRHLFSFPTVNATGVRIITVTGGTAIDEIELYATGGPMMVLAPVDQIIPANTSRVVNYAISDGANLTVTVASSNPAVVPLLGVSPTGTRTVTIPGFYDPNGSAEITLTVSNGIQSTSDSFTVTTKLNLIKEGGTFRSGNLATTGTAFAKDVLPGFVEHTIAHLNDGFYSREKSWIAGSPNSFAGINLGATAVPINGVAFGRDNTGVWFDRALGTYTIQFTTVANPNASTPDASWATIGIVDTSDFTFPAKRHLFSFAQVNATGLRILTVANGTSIDEIEIYDSLLIGAPENISLYQSLLQPAQILMSSVSSAPLTFRTSPYPGLTVSAASSNQSVVSNSNIILGGNGLNRTVTVTANATQAGSATITLTVSDGTLSASGSFVVTVVPAVTYSAGDSAGLHAAVQSANGSAAFPIIKFTGNITLTGQLAFLTRSSLVDGGGFTIDGNYMVNGIYNRGFVAGDPSITKSPFDVTFKDLTIQGVQTLGKRGLMSWTGGDGGASGGYGGAIFVSSDVTVRLDNVNLISNLAKGGKARGIYHNVTFAGAPGSDGLGLGNIGRGKAGDDSVADPGGQAGLGFGGGGGGSAIRGNGGVGGYGSGGGGTASTYSWGKLGGFGGGQAFGAHGGGGAGLGGAVFVQAGGNLQITGPLEVSGNAVAAGGTRNGDGGEGSAFGSGIFGQHYNILTFSPKTSLTTQIVADVIADELGSGGGGNGSGGRISIFKEGPGTTTLSGANTFTGTTTIKSGRLLLQNTNNSVITNEAIFGPFGVATGSFTQTATGSFQVRLGSTSDRLDAASVNLNGSLDIILGAGAPATPITIINNTGAAPVTGTFTGLAEGAIFINNGKKFGISYVGGTGNDVVLTITPPFVVTGDGGTATTSNLATRGVAFAKDFLPGFAAHTIPHLNDGIYGNANSWIGNSANSFAGISFGSRPILINQVAFGRDNTGVWSDRALGTYTIQFTTVANPNASTPDNSWTTVGTIDTATLPNPALRHVFNLPTLLVTGIRVIAAVEGIAIDELEVYNSTTGLMVTAPDHQTVAVDTSSAALPFTTSADSGLTFSASSDNPALIPAANIIFGGTAGNRTVILTPLAGRTGVAIITLTISNGVATASDSFLLTVPTNTSVTGLFGFGLHMEAANNTAGMPNLALVVNGGSAFAQDVIPIAPHQISCLNDGVYGNPNSWVGNSTSSFAGINLGGLKMVNRVAFGRDNTGVLADSRWNGIYTIQYTTVANPDANTVSWTTIGVIDRGYAPYFLPPSILRQLFSFPPVMATGVRILTVAAAGSPHGLGIDELEIYNVTGPDIMVEQVAYKPLLPGVSTLNYGSVVQLSASTIQLTITNPGTANLLLGTISKTGANPADFTVGTLGTTTLLPGTSTTLALTFAPGALGARHSSLSIASNATGVKTNFNFYAAGTGVSFTSPAGGISSGLTLVETGGTFAAGNLASALQGGSAFAKDVIPGFAAHTIAHLNDGVYGNANSWINNSANSFGGINLGGLKWFGRIAFGRNNAIPQTTIDRAIGLYSLQYTTVPNPAASTTNWTTIGTVDLGNAALFGTEASGGPAKRHLFSFTPVQATGMRIVTVVDGSCIDEIEVYPYFTPQELWRQSHFSTTANTGQAADGADADSDGELNLLEYATGQNPNAASRAGLSVVREASILKFTYPRNIAAMNSGVTFIVETSDTLSADSWTTTSVSAPAILSDNGTTQQIQVSVPSNVPRRFVRLRVFN